MHQSSSWFISFQLKRKNKFRAFFPNFFPVKFIDKLFFNISNLLYIFKTSLSFMFHWCLFLFMIRQLVIWDGDVSWKAKPSKDLIVYIQLIMVQSHTLLLKKKKISYLSYDFFNKKKWLALAFRVSLAYDYMIKFVQQESLAIYLCNYFFLSFLLPSILKIDKLI